MAWELWIVPIIALAVWILSQLRGEEPPRDRQPFGGGRKPASEVERFLEEINRLRQQTAQQPRLEPRPETAPLAEVLPAEPVEPSAAPVFERPSPPPPPPPPPPRPEKVRVRAARPRRRELARPVPEVLDVIPVATPAAPVMAAYRPTPVSPAVAQLRALLKSPGTLQTAVLLQEVLGPPRCRWRR